MNFQKVSLKSFGNTFFGYIMPSKKPTWQEKLTNSKGYPKVEEIKGKMSKKWGAGTLVIPAPIEVDELMKKVPKGKLTTHKRNSLSSCN
jgi:hypothetical protein